MRKCRIPAAILLAVFLVSGAMAQGPAIGRLAKVTGTVWLVPRGGDPKVDLKKIAAGADVREGDTIVTDMGSTAQINFQDQSTIKIGERSRCMIKKKGSRLKDRSRLHLFSGKIRVKVKAARVARGSFEVSTPTAVAGVRGTDFLVDCPAGRETRVVVFDGVVSVKSLLREVVGVVRVPAKHFTKVGVAKAPRAPVEMTQIQIQEGGSHRCGPLLRAARRRIGKNGGT